jgi:multidrug efflux pump subunit AcrB
MSGETSDTFAKGPAGKIAAAFMHSKLTPLFMLAAVALGVFATEQLPREEEPQIIVPMVDVFVGMPGASPAEVETRVTRPMEELLREIPGVEYLYSTSMPGMAAAIVRFEVGRNEEDALVRLHDKLRANFDRMPPGVTEPLVKPRSIDDVPVLSLTLWSPTVDAFELRRVAAELRETIKQVPDVSDVTIIGGEKRQVRIELDPQRLAARSVTPLGIVGALQAHNSRLASGSFARDNRSIIVETGTVLRSVEDIGAVVVGAAEGRPVFLRDVANIADGGEEPAAYVRFGAGAAATGETAAAGEGSWPAVTLAVAKRKGTNAVEVVEAALARLETVRPHLVPADVHVSVTRNYGETAREKSDELLLHMGIAVISVALLVLFTLGRREAVIVFLAIPVTLALTLAVFYLYGYTLNRITLFALIFSIGILVDDAIVVVENIARHYRLPENRGRSLSDIATRAVSEVGNPTILATMTVVAAILPMAFVRGLMGPYMRPIPVGATAAMIFSLIVAFMVTPWATVRLLGRGDAAHHDHGEAEGRSTRAYRRFMGALLATGARRWGFLVGVVVLLLGSMSLVGIGFVEVKMLPFDNKAEFQVVVDMPEGTSLEQTARVTQAIADELRKQPEVTDYQSYVGTSGPYTFNGLVRHYFLRRGPNVADIKVGLLPKHARTAQSHDIAKRVRAAILPVAQRFGANIKVAEVPPGPPVLQTLVAEVYGPDPARQIEIAGQIRKEMEAIDGIVDVDWYVEEQPPKIRFEVDEVKAALHGVAEAEVARTLRLALDGMPAGLLHAEREKEDVALLVHLDRAERSDLDRLVGLHVAAADGHLVSLAELVRAVEVPTERNIYHKNLQRVTYVTADLAGTIESPVYAMLALQPRLDAITLADGSRLEQLTASLPTDTETYSVKWDGEWHITYEVFRDLGLAFAAVLVLIYLLVVAWFQSFLIPLVIMSAIPFSLVGILPAHGFMGAFFTATSMIGFIAGAGIVVRNSIILVDFIELRLAEGMPLVDAVIDAGAVRFRPMLLTAAAVVVGAAVILFDPIFQGLAISLMAGEVASLLLSRMTVPVVYYMVKRREAQRSAARDTRAPAAPTALPTEV